MYIHKYDTYTNINIVIVCLPLHGPRLCVFKFVCMCGYTRGNAI